MSTVVTCHLAIGNCHCQCCTVCATGYKVDGNFLIDLLQVNRRRLHVRDVFIAREAPQSLPECDGKVCNQMLCNARHYIVFGKRFISCGSNDRKRLTCNICPAGEQRTDRESETRYRKSLARQIEKSRIRCEQTRIEICGCADVSISVRFVAFGSRPSVHNQRYDGPIQSIERQKRKHFSFNTTIDA